MKVTDWVLPTHIEDDITNYGILPHPLNLVFLLSKSTLLLIKILDPTFEIYLLVPDMLRRRNKTHFKMNTLTLIDGV